MEIEESVDDKFKNLIFQTFRLMEKEIISNPYYIMGRSNKNTENKLYLQILCFLQKLYFIQESEIDKILWINNSFSNTYYHIGNNSRYIIPLSDINLDYIYFDKTIQNIDLLPKFKKIGKRFISKEGISGYLSSLNISSTEYKHINLSIQPYSLIYIPNYILFKKNYSNSIELQIIIKSLFSKFIEEYDPEIDD
jgi:hypothetical protein